MTAARPNHCFGTTDAFDIGFSVTEIFLLGEQHLRTSSHLFRMVMSDVIADSMITVEVGLIRSVKLTN